MGSLGIYQYNNNYAEVNSPRLNFIVLCTHAFQGGEIEAEVRRRAVRGEQGEGREATLPVLQRLRNAIPPVEDLKEKVVILATIELCKSHQKPKF